MLDPVLISTVDTFCAVETDLGDIVRKFYALCKALWTYAFDILYTINGYSINLVGISVAYVADN